MERSRDAALPRLSLMPLAPKAIPLDDLDPRRCLAIARACGLGALAIGLSVLVGWLFDVRWLMTVLPGVVAMKPNTAAAFCLTGLSLFWLARSPAKPGGQAKKLGPLLAATAAAIGAVSLVEYGTRHTFGLDELLFKDVVVSSAPGRMAPITAFNFVCVGVALVLLHVRQGTLWAHALAGGAAFTSLLAILGDAYGVTSLYQAGSIMAVALHTAVGFLLLCIGVWCAASQDGFMAVLTGRGMSGMLVRRYGLAAILVPFFIGWLRVLGGHRGWYGIELGAMLVAMTNAATFATLVWVGASSVRTAERQQAGTQRSLNASEERLQRVVERLSEGLVISDLNGRMLLWNRAALELHGIPTLGNGLRILPDFVKIFQFATLDGIPVAPEDWPIARVFRGEHLHDYEVQIERPDQQWKKIFRYSGSTVQDADGESLAFLTFTDVTQQKQVEALAKAANAKLHQAQLDLEMRVRQRTAELAAANAGLQLEILERARAEQANQQIMDHSLDLICTFDAHGRFVQVSRACETLLGWQPEELIGRRYLDMINPEDLEKSRAAVVSIMNGAQARGFENRLVRPDGTEVSIVWTAQWSHQEQIMFCVARDMTEQKQVESELLRAKEAAEAASRAKSEFLANMSHEIRTPMNGIIGMTDLVLETHLERQQREYLGLAKSSAVTLLGLINDILDFSKIEAGKLDLECLDFSLRECIGSMLKPLGLRADQKGLELTAEILADVPDYLTGDALRLRQILINLTDNAIKFTSQGDVMLRVEVDAAPAGEHGLHFTVRDTGIGIPAQKQALIFEAFAQADGTTTRTYGGTGLGLAIASRLVEQMRGRIWVESTPGKGTAFHFTARFGVPQVPLALTQPMPLPGLEGLAVLVVDDNAINRRILSEMLLHWRMKPCIVASGEAAVAELLRAARAGIPYPLIILDGMMPKMDGFMTAQEIRDHPELSGATVMMLSSSMPTGATARCAEVGVTSYLTKPVSQSDLMEAILVALGTEAAKPAAAPEIGKAIVPAAEAASAPAGLRILLAEDNTINRALATGILEKRGHSLAHAANGREAVVAAMQEPFDLIFMDVQMPEMDGFEATRRIRELETPLARHTPISAMTAHAMSGDRERCLAAGMDEYISKPLQKSELFALIDRVAESRCQQANSENASPDGTVDEPSLALCSARETARKPQVFSREQILEQLDGDEMLLQRLVELFRENTPELLGSIREAITRRDAPEVARAAHALLSSLGIFGAMEAHQLASQLEAGAERLEHEEQRRLFSALTREVEAVEASFPKKVGMGMAQR